MDRDHVVSRIIAILDENSGESYVVDDLVVEHIQDSLELLATLQEIEDEFGFIAEPNPSTRVRDLVDQIVDIDEFYIQNIGAGYLGNSPIWWGKDDCGYTQWLNEAHRFTGLEADKVINRCRGSHQLKKWPCDVVDRAARVTVDIQDLNKLRTDDVKDVTA